MRLFVSFVASFVAFVSPHAMGQQQAAEASWCFEEQPQGEGMLLDDVQISPVRVSRMSGALARLRERTAIELSWTNARRLAARPLRRGSRYYLVRSSITGGSSASMNELVQTAINRARYDVSWREQDRRIALSVFQTVIGDRVPHNLAIIVRADVPIIKSYLGCFIMD